MSLKNRKFTISVKKFQTLAQNVNEQNVNCLVFLNSTPMASLQIADSQPSFTVADTPPQSRLQLVFQSKESGRSIGSVTLPVEYVLSANRNRFEQWVTLFDNQGDDIFDGVIGQDDQEWPRVLIKFEAQNDQAVNQNMENEMSKEYDTTINHEGHSMSKIDHIPLCEQSHMDFKIQIVKANEYDKDFKDSVFEQTISLNQTPNSCNGKEGGLLIKGLPRRGGKEEGLTMSPASPISVHDSRNMSQINETFAKHEKNNSNLSEHNGVEISKQTAQMIDLEQKNKLLALKVEELQKTVEELENEKATMKLNGDDSHERIHHLKIELERLKFHNENYEVMFSETEHQLGEIKSQLTKELGSKSELLKEKLELVGSLKQTREAYEQLKNTYSEKRLRSADLNDSRRLERSPNTSHHSNESTVSGYLRQKYEEMLSQKDKRSREERNNLEEESSQLRQELIAAKSQVQCDEIVIQNLQKEIYSLRQKEEHYNSSSIEGVLHQNEEKIRGYEAKIKSAMEMCSTLLFNNAEVAYESFEDFLSKVKNVLEERNQEFKVLKESNEDTKQRLNISENRLLADSLWNQINDFKHQITVLEKDREILRNELTKSNENYIKLTNKYTDLTEVLTTLQKPSASATSSSQKGHNSNHIGKTATAVFGKNTTARTNYRTFEAPDEVETKLIEFTVQYNLQPTLLTKLEKGLYLYNGRKINLKVVNGKLMVKLGQGYKSLQEFLKVGNPCRTPPRSALVTRESRERSNEAKSFYDRSEYTQTLATESSQKDLSLDKVLTTSRSYIKENLRESGVRLSESGLNISRTKSTMKDQAKLRQIVSSKSLERKLSFSLNRIINRNPREVNPF